MKSTDLHALRTTDAAYTILDVREADELASTPSIRGATHMPMGKVFTEAAAGKLPKDKQIVVYCKTGGRAGIVERELTERGFTITSLEGGLDAYVNE